MNTLQHLLFVFCSSLLWACQFSLIGDKPITEFSDFISEISFAVITAAVFSVLYIVLSSSLSKIFKSLSKEKIRSALTSSFMALPISALFWLSLTLIQLSLVAITVFLLGLSVGVSIYKLSKLSKGEALSNKELLYRLWPLWALMLAIAIFFHPVFFKRRRD